MENKNIDSVLPSIEIPLGSVSLVKSRFLSLILEPFFELQTHYPVSLILYFITFFCIFTVAVKNTGTLLMFA